MLSVFNAVPFLSDDISYLQQWYAGFVTNMDEFTRSKDITKFQTFLKDTVSNDFKFISSGDFEFTFDDTESFINYLKSSRDKVDKEDHFIGLPYVIYDNDKQIAIAKNKAIVTGYVDGFDGRVWIINRNEYHAQVNNDMYAKNPWTITKLSVDVEVTRAGSKIIG